MPASDPTPTRENAESNHILWVRDQPVSYTGVGHGAPVLLLHSSGASRRQWRALIERLAPRYRVLAPDLIGHGDTPAPDGRVQRMQDDAEVVLAFADAVQQPLHVIGHSYGAGVALFSAHALQERLLSLSLIEPAYFSLLRQMGEIGAWEEIRTVAERHRRHFERGELEICAEDFMTYWIGAKAWQQMPAPRREAVVGTMGSVAAIWQAIYDDSQSPALHAGLQVPTLLLRGSGTTLAARRVVELLADLLPHATSGVIAGAGHMSPLTHPEPVNEALEAFVERHSGDAGARPQVGLVHPAPDAGA